MPDYSSDLFFQTTILTLIGPLFTILRRAPEAKSAQRQTLLQRVPPFIFYFFKETYKTGRAQRVPPLDFFRNCATFFRKFFNVPKGSPFEIFDILQRNVC